MAVYFKKYVNYINTICEINAYFFIVRQTVPALNTVLYRGLIYQNRRKSLKVYFLLLHYDWTRYMNYCSLIRRVHLAVSV
jgi:hypothetical protein